MRNLHLIIGFLFNKLCGLIETAFLGTGVFNTLVQLVLIWDFEYIWTLIVTEKYVFILLADHHSR